MTKKNILVLFMIFILALSGCGEQKTENKKNNEENDVQDKQEVINTEDKEVEEFFDKYIYTKERPIAVMVDNDDDNARPHAGLNDAYLIYEMAVEGGSTRFMALFRNTDTKKIGPVRSSRHYYLDYALENDAIYTHFGWSPKATTDMSALRVNNINGVNRNDEDIFWRERKFKGDWHSAYTSIENIKNKAQQKGYKTITGHANSIDYTDEYFEIGSGNIADNVTLKYSKKYTTGYSYNKEKKVYEKTINAKPHLMQDETVLEVKNIIIQLIADTSLGDGSDRRNINTTGSGKGYYISNGEYEEITWSKASRSGNTFYKKADGTELRINPGKTIINIIAPGSVTFE